MSMTDTGTVKAASTESQETPLSRKQLFFFALPAIPAIALNYPVGFFLPPFLTTEMGLSLSAVAGIILLAKIWDIITDPVVGVLCDRVPSRWGRRRHWIVIATPVLMLAVVMLFMPRLLIDGMTVVYALIAMCVMQLGQTVFGLNQQAWGAELSGDYNERSRILGWRHAIGMFAPLAVFGIGMAVEFTSADPEVANGDKLFYIGIFALIALPLSTLLAVTNVQERPSQIKQVRERISFIDSWKLLIKNRIMLRLLLIDVFAALPFSISIAIKFFYVAYIIEAPEMMSSLLLFVFVAGLCSMPIWVRVSQHFEKHKLLTFAYFMAAILSIQLIWLGPGDIVEFALISCSLSVFTSGPSFLLRSIVADVVDTDTLDTGEERTGAFFALIEMTQKFVPAIAVPLVFPFLQLMGFDPQLGLNNTQDALDAIKYAFVLFPPIPMLIAGYLLMTFPLGREQQREIQEKIRSTHGA